MKNDTDILKDVELVGKVFDFRGAISAKNPPIALIGRIFSVRDDEGKIIGKVLIQNALSNLMIGFFTIQYDHPYRLDIENKDQSLGAFVIARPVNFLENGTTYDHVYIGNRGDPMMSFFHTVPLLGDILL